MVIFGMFRHMNYVYEVYREGSFSKAAAKLYISQPALSATVKKVETEGVPLKLFEEEPFVLLRSHNDTRERVERICGRAGITPKVAWKLDQMLTTYHLTERGMGISFVSDTALRYVSTGSDVCYYRIDDPDAERNVYLYYRRNKYFTRSMAEFMRLAAAELEQD